MLAFRAPHPNAAGAVKVWTLNCTTHATGCAEVHSLIMEPCEVLVKDVKAYLESAWAMVISEVFDTFPKLKVAVIEQV